MYTQLSSGTRGLIFAQAAFIYTPSLCEQTVKALKAVQLSLHCMLICNHELAQKLESVTQNKHLILLNFRFWLCLFIYENHVMNINNIT